MRRAWRAAICPVVLSCAGLFSLLAPPPSPAAQTGGLLPLSKIILYSSGVGYFQHDGTVTDRTQWDLRLQTHQINDVLKSLVVQDFGGGKISTVTYGSRDPATKTLDGFGINLNGNPTMSQILTQVRGERVEVTAPNSLLGTILGVEKKTESLSDGQTRRTIEQEYLNLLTDDGFRLLPFAQIQRVKLLDAGRRRCADPRSGAGTGSADLLLVEPRDAAERTRDLYRFSIAVDAGKTATLRVKEMLPIQESILLMESGLDQIAYFQQAKEVSAKVKEALQRIVHLRSKLDDTRAQRTRLEQRIGEITAEHSRIRENMQRLQQNSDLYNRYVKKLDGQETELEKLRKEIEALKATEEERRRELQNYVMTLDIV